MVDDSTCKSTREQLSKQKTMLWEALSSLRSRRGNLDEETRHTFVNYVCMRVCFPQFDDDPPARRLMSEHGIYVDTIFYDIANLEANDPHPEAWRDWDPAGKNDPENEC